MAKETTPGTWDGLVSVLQVRAEMARRKVTHDQATAGIRQDEWANPRCYSARQGRSGNWTP